jgi:hypothetical protein
MFGKNNFSYNTFRLVNKGMATPSNDLINGMNDKKKTYPFFFN